MLLETHQIPADGDRAVSHLDHLLRQEKKKRERSKRRE